MRRAAFSTLVCAFAAALGLAPGAQASRFVLGEHAARDAMGALWLPLGAERVAGGRDLAVAGGVIRRTASPRLYRGCREGVRALRVPVTGGPATYAVVLRFLGRRERPAPVDVLAEGAVVAPGLRVTGPRVGFPVVLRTVVTDGTLSLRFRGDDGDGDGGLTLCALSARRIGTSVAPPKMVWGDDFVGKAGAPVNGGSWEYYVGVGSPPGWGAGELETYTYRPANVAVDGQGMLNITARRETYADRDGVARDYTSGRIGTDGRLAFTYGLLSARLRLPAGKGLWPAFWLLGDDVDRIGWPPAGEIDVAELMGSDPTRLYGSVHGPRLAAPTEPYHLNRTTTSPVSLAADFHTYAVLRVPGAVQLLLDGRPYQAYTPQDLGPGRPWVYDKPFRIMLNLAVGGVWDGPPDATTPFPATLTADWIKLEQ